jgi:hypothetical protein
MSTGAMLIGNFDGDGKSDVFHAIAGSDSAKIWYSNGDGTFDVRSFSPWPGYVMDTGTWHVGDFNGDGRADLLHILPGKNSVNIWLSKGRGLFKVTNFLPWPDYPIEKGRWLVGDFNNDGYDDVVHILESEGRVNIWLSTGDGSFIAPSVTIAIVVPVLIPAIMTTTHRTHLVECFLLLVVERRVKASSFGWIVDSPAAIAAIRFCAKARRPGMVAKSGFMDFAKASWSSLRAGFWASVKRSRLLRCSAIRSPVIGCSDSQNRRIIIGSPISSPLCQLFIWA